MTYLPTTVLAGIQVPIRNKEAHNGEQLAQTDETDHSSSVRMETEKTESGKEEAKEDYTQEIPNRSRKETMLVVEAFRREYFYPNRHAENKYMMWRVQAEMKLTKNIIGRVADRQQ